MEALPAIPAIGPPRNCRRPAIGAGTVRDQGEGAVRRQADAAPSSGGSRLHGVSGVFYIGRGEQFASEELEAYPPGTVIVLPGGTPHFHWAKSGEYVTQVTGIGPLGLEYVDLSDDTRNG
jgi:hypothetical protein